MNSSFDVENAEEKNSFGNILIPLKRNRSYLRKMIEKSR